jgi:hypothetical protein
MVPRVSTPGRSFAGAGMYYLHDKEALTNDRVAFTHTENIHTDDPEKALKWMAFSAQAANEEKERSHTPGRRIQNSVWTVSLSWHPEQDPSKEDMIAAGNSYLKDRGLQEHQTLMVSHNDEEHPHIHLIVNLVHPTTLKLNRQAVSHAKIKSSQWAEEYEKKNGKIYCDQRVENNEKRRKGEFVKHKEPQADFRAHVNQIYRSADNGAAFRSALEQHGYKLAQGKRIVVIDAAGKTYSLSRQLEGIKARDIRAKLADIEIPPVKEERGQQEGKTGKKPVYADRDRQARESQDRIDRAAIEEEKQLARTGLMNRLQDTQHAEWGRFYDKKQRAQAALDAKMETQYGAHERQLRKDIEAMQGKSRAQLWLLKQSGAIAKDADLKNMQASLATIEQRKTEMTGKMNRELETERAQIETRHAEERDAVPNDFTPQSLDPLVTSIRQQQEVQNRAYLGAAAPADVNAAAPAGGGDAGYESRRAEFMNAASETRESPTPTGPAPSAE